MNGKMRYSLSKEQQYLATFMIVIACTLVAGVMFPYFDEANLIMVYLVGVVLTASQFGRRASILASILSVAAFDFFLVHPYLTFAVSDTQYLVTFAVMLLVALTISTMTAQIRQQAETARQREQHTASLYNLSRELSNTSGISQLIRSAAQHISQVFDSPVVILLPDSNHNLVVHTPENVLSAETSYEAGVARWVFENRQSAGFSTPIIPGARGLYLPLVTSSQVMGVMVIYPRQHDMPFLSEQHHLLETLANQTALAMERTRLAAEADAARMEIETERLRNSLLSSISHDLRTPLASITGAASSLLQNELDTLSRQELHQIIYEEAEHLNRLVGNLLDMTRIESGGIHVKKQWELLEEVVGSTLLRMKKQLTHHHLRKKLPDNLLLVPMDSVLIEQVLVNLIDNAVKYSPSGTTIELAVEVQEKEIVVSVADEGVGIPEGSEERIFEKFYRIAPEHTGGVGLGLAICRSIVEAHGGRIWVENRAGEGSIFRFTLPLEGKPPEVMLDE